MIITILNELSKVSFRPIPDVYVSKIRDFVNDSIKEDEEKTKVLSNVSNMPKKEVIQNFFNMCFERNKNFEPFLFACICLRISEIEKQSVLPNIQPFNLNWKDYMNFGGNSSVSKYSINDSFLAVIFDSGPIVYVYSYNRTGVAGTEYMKKCATNGSGLGHCTSSYFRDHRGFTTVRYKN